MAFLAVGEPGVGKSTIGNFVLFEKSKAGKEDEGFKTAPTAEACTQDSSQITSKDGQVRFTDVPGVPDTNPEKTKIYYDLIVAACKEPTNAIIYMFPYERINGTKFENASLLFREINRATCPKVCVINDKNDYEDFGDGEEVDRPHDKEYEKVREEIKQHINIDFDLFIVIKDKKDIKGRILELKKRFSDRPPLPSHHLKTYSELQELKATLTDKHACLAQVRKDKLEEISSLRAAQDAQIAIAGTLSATATAATVGAFFSFGATLGIATPTFAAASAIIAKAAWEKSKLNQMEQEIESDPTMERLAGELQQAVAEFEKLDRDISAASSSRRVADGTGEAC